LTLASMRESVFRATARGIGPSPSCAKGVVRIHTVGPALADPDVNAEGVAHPPAAALAA
jgi:hypothetical protein